MGCRRMGELEGIRATLLRLRKEGKILLAYLFGSFSKGTEHVRSDIDLAVYVRAESKEDAVKVVDAILLSSERPVEILRLDDEDESPFVVQQALKGVPIVEPDRKMYYEVARRALHYAEEIRFRRWVKAKMMSYKEIRPSPLRESGINGRI